MVDIVIEFGDLQALGITGVHYVYVEPDRWGAFVVRVLDGRQTCAGCVVEKVKYTDFKAADR